MQRALLQGSNSDRKSIAIASRERNYTTALTVQENTDVAAQCHYKIVIAIP